MTKSEHNERLERVLRAHARKQNLPSVGPLLFLVLLVVAFTWFFRWHKQDLDGAPLETITTTVTKSEPVVWQSGDEKSGDDRPTFITFRTSGVVQGVAVMCDLPWRLPTGERVIVTYRNGKSGGLYVESMIPVTPPKR